MTTKERLRQEYVNFELKCRYFSQYFMLLDKFWFSHTFHHNFETTNGHTKFVGAPYDWRLPSRLPSGRHEAHLAFTVGSRYQKPLYHLQSLNKALCTSDQHCETPLELSFIRLTKAIATIPTEWSFPLVLSCRKRPLSQHFNNSQGHPTETF